MTTPRGVTLGVGLALALVACGNGASDGDEGWTDGGPSTEAGPPPPGRPTATVCASSPFPTTFLPDGGSGPCAIDSDCSLFPSSLAGHCVSNPDGGPNQCDFDQCLGDSDCGTSGVCSCQRSGNGTGGASINICVPGDCRVDSDCGKRGPCSPTVSSSCGPNFGVAGYYCHTASDECATDTDCGNDGSAEAPYCAYDPTVGHWICGTGICSG